MELKIEIIMHGLQAQACWDRSWQISENWTHMSYHISYHHIYLLKAIWHYMNLGLKNYQELSHYTLAEQTMHNYFNFGLRRMHDRI